MTAFSGIFESFFSRLVKRMQRVFPPEVTGLVVALVGLELVGIGVPRFWGYGPVTKALDLRDGAVALLTLASMLIPTVWSKGKLRLYPIVIGLCVGYAASIVMHARLELQCCIYLCVLVSYSYIDLAAKNRFGGCAEIH